MQLFLYLCHLGVRLGVRWLVYSDSVVVRAQGLLKLMFKVIFDLCFLYKKVCTLLDQFEINEDLGLEMTHFVCPTGFRLSPPQPGCYF